MTHRKFQRIRYLCLGIFFTTVIACVAGIVALVKSGAGFPTEKILPVILIAGIILFGLLLLLGRTFCGFLCPLGLAGDIVWRITSLLHIPKLSRSEKTMKVVKRFRNIFFGFLIVGIGSLVVVTVFFPNLLAGVKIPIYIPIVFFGVTVLFNLFAKRFFCNFCPIGSLIGLFEKTSVVKLKKDTDACVFCGACYEACPMRIKSVYLENTRTKVSDAQCIYCGECIKKCQEDGALSLTVCGKKIYTSSGKDFTECQFDGIAVDHERGKDEP